jgi:hypothetical protein
VQTVRLPPIPFAWAHLKLPGLALWPMKSGAGSSGGHVARDRGRATGAAESTGDTNVQNIWQTVVALLFDVSDGFNDGASTSRCPTAQTYLGDRFSRWLQLADFHKPNTGHYCFHGGDNGFLRLVTIPEVKNYEALKRQTIVCRRDDDRLRVCPSQIAGEGRIEAQRDRVRQWFRLGRTA